MSEKCAGRPPTPPAAAAAARRITARQQCGNVGSLMQILQTSLRAALFITMRYVDVVICQHVLVETKWKPCQAPTT
jgi:hypothetical protein